jgi:hypothetical protein
MGDHGCRRTYQAQHCRCTPCRAANAAYVAHLRRQHLQGHPPLGTLVPAGEARRFVRQLEAEGIPEPAIAATLGLASPRLRLPRTGRITLRKALKIRWVVRTRLILGADGPGAPVPS